MNIQKKQEKKPGKITFLSKEAIQCPVCDGSFKREELFSGRINVHDLTDELHRLYKPTAAYGEVIPLIYEMVVCPHCFYAAFRSDFIPAGKKLSQVLQDNFQARVESIQELFEHVDFQDARTIKEGLASYFLVLQCYEFFPKEFSPTIKRAIASVRAAWLSADLHTKYPDEHWDHVADLFYHKARFFYKHALELEQSGKEPYSSTVRNLGPDVDKNYGHEGVIYMSAILELKYGPRDNMEYRIKELNIKKNAIARMFGVGKKTKAKPGPLLDKARELYEAIKKELKDQADDEE